jgi:formyl-CoA transferase
MFDVMAEWLTVPLLHADGGDHPRRIGLAHPSIAPYGVFTTRDGRALLISIQNDHEWKALCDGVLGRPELASDPRFATNVRRVQVRVETDASVARTFASLDATELVERLSRAEIAFAMVNDLHGLSSHPHLRRVSVGTPNGAV